MQRPKVRVKLEELLDRQGTDTASVPARIGSIRCLFAKASISLTIFSILSCSQPRFVSFSPPPKAADFILNMPQGDFQLFKDMPRYEITFMFYGYSRCPDICPLVLQKLGDTMRSLDPAAAAKIRIIFVSVDSVNDSPEKSAAYAQRFHPSIIGLAGDAKQIQSITKSYGVYALKNDKSVDHSSSIFWINSKGEILKLIPPNFKSADLMHDIRLTLD